MFYWVCIRILKAFKFCFKNSFWFCWLYDSCSFIYFLYILCYLLSVYFCCILCYLFCGSVICVYRSERPLVSVLKTQSWSFKYFVHGLVEFVGLSRLYDTCCCCFIYIFVFCSSVLLGLWLGSKRLFNFVLQTQIFILFQYLLYMHQLVCLLMIAIASLFNFCNQCIHDQKALPIQYLKHKKHNLDFVL